MGRFWVVMFLVIGFLGGCGGPSQSAPTTPQLIATPTPIITPTQSPTSTPNPTVTPEPTLDPGAESRAVIVLTVLNCTWKFCPPEELEQQTIRVIGKPDILTAAPLSELHVRLTYDSTQLTAEEAVVVFEEATGLDVEIREQ